MKKFELLDEKTIRHNLVPELFIEVIKLDRQNDYNGKGVSFDDIFNELLIKGWHFIFRVKNAEDFEHLSEFSHILSILKRAGKWYKAQITIGNVALEKYKEEKSPYENDVFKLQKSQKNNHWIATHKVANFVVEFEHKKFNETQKTTTIYDENNHTKVAKYLRELSEWLAVFHRDKIF